MTGVCRKLTYRVWFELSVSVVPEISNTRKLIHTQNSNFWSKSSLPVAHLGMACCGCASMRAERAGSIRVRGFCDDEVSIVA
jgi:hypothetical protein